MSYLTITIKNNETDEVIRNIDCDIIIAGFAGGETHGGITFGRATGLDTALAVYGAEQQVKYIEDKNPMFTATKMLVTAYKKGEQNER